MGEVKTVLEFTQEEILENQYISDNIDDFFNSDILILDSILSFREVEVSDIITEYKELSIKKYFDDTRFSVSYCLDPLSLIGIIKIGIMVISTLSGLITIGDFINKKYGSKPDSLIRIQLFNKTVNNTYIHHEYKGTVNQFCNHEIKKMEDDFKPH